MGKKHICVIMSTYNGARYLREQLDSIFGQTEKDIHLFVRDDGSKDETVQILKEYDGVEVICGKNVGAKNSFIDALMQAPEADFYAFADQDDVWDADKVEVAVKAMAEAMAQDTDKPVLYTCYTRLVDAELKVIRDVEIIYPPVKPFLCGEMMVSAGCTMAWNHTLMKQLRKCRPESFAMHDAWLMWVNQAIGGVTIRDGKPHINYRQHGNNVVGGKRTLLESIRRRIRFHKKMGPNYLSRMLNQILTVYRDVMPDENVARGEFVCSYRKSWRNTIALLTDKQFFQGRTIWKLENYLLVLLRRY